MPDKSSTIIGILLFLVSSISFGQEGATVTGVVSPAWVNQQNERIALKPGYRVTPTDMIETSGGGRVQLVFSNNAEFQLGEKVQFKAHQLEKPQTDTEPYQGFVEVLKGAFRYIGESFGPSPQSTDFRVKVGFSTIGLRGTDFWGVTDRITDTVVLIDGSITVTPDTGQPFTMNTPQTIVQSIAGVGASAIEKVDMETLQKSAAETTLPKGQGIMTREGRYQVILGSLESMQKAQQYASKLDAQGYPAMAEYVSKINRNRIVINGFVSREDAKFFASNTARSLEIPDAWIRKSF